MLIYLGLKALFPSKGKGYDDDLSRPPAMRSLYLFFSLQKVLSPVRVVSVTVLLFLFLRLFEMLKVLLDVDADSSQLVTIKMVRLHRP